MYKKLNIRGYILGSTLLDWKLGFFEKFSVISVTVPVSTNVQCLLYVPRHNLMFENTPKGWFVILDFMLVQKSLPNMLQSLVEPKILYRAWNMYDIWEYQVFSVILHLGLYLDRFSVNYSKFYTVFLLFYQNSVDFLQKNFISNLLCTIVIYSKKPKGVSS
jgi:hypothetical protein